MGSALTSALSGLRVHQQYLDVIGNNLANSNTTGFRSSRVTFSDVLSQLLRSGSAPTGSIGGTNPIQVGLGVQVHSIDTRSAQGVLDNTGNPFDLAIQGEGFFELNAGGGRRAYTRAGIFGLDQDNFLVDTASGFRVASIMNTGGDVQLPVNSLLPANQTTELQLGGNLSARVSGPVAEMLATSAPFLEGTSAELTGAAGEPFAINDGDTMTISVDGGAAQTVTLDSSNITVGAATAAEVAAAIATQVTGVTAVDVGGQVMITSDRTGSSSSLAISPGSTATTLGLSTAQVAGTETAATAATRLNDLADNVTNYTGGDTILISGTDAAGAAVSGTFLFGGLNDGTTLGELVTFIDGLYGDASSTLSAAGDIELTADVAGTALLSLSLTDGSSNTDFGAHGFKTLTDGTGPDQVTTSIDVFDQGGLRHTLTFTLTRVSNTEWDLGVVSDNSNDTLIDDSVQGIRFNEDGSLGSPGSSASIEIQFDRLTTSQSINIDFGTIGQYDGVTQLGESNSLRALSQDGFKEGDLETVSVRSDGVIEGFYSNGQNRELDQIAVATFANPQGLARLGNSMFEASPNSGIPGRQAAGSGSSGTVISGALEGSNVDVAEEFVRLIEAQRGFQANARVIRVADELLVELVNLV